MTRTSGVVTGMGEGWVVVFPKSEEQPRSTKLAEGNVAGMLFGYGVGGVVVAVVGPSNTGLRWAWRWVVKAVVGPAGGACSRRVTL